MLLSFSTSAVAPKAPVIRRNERRLVFMGEYYSFHCRHTECTRIRPMKKVSTVLVAVAALCTGLAAGVQDRVDFSVIEKIRAEGMDRSKILETFDYLVTAIGPR